MIKSVKIFIIPLLLLAVVSCKRTERRSTVMESVLARVGDSVLKEDDINGVYSSVGPDADSLMLLEAYVNSWVRKQVKIQEAERLVAGSGVDIEAMVNDYRNSLLTHRLDQYYVDKYMDTIIPPAQVEAYYMQHRSQFVLDRPIVKGRIVRVPDSYKQKAKLKEYMSSSQAERQKDFIDMCGKNNFLLTEFESWVDFSEFLFYFPTIRGKDYDYMLTNRKVQEFSDAGNKYYVQVTDNLNKGELAPLERVDHIVRRIIYNQRSGEVIRCCEDSLYNAALDNGNILINIK